MATPAPLFQVDDQTDEDFFDKLVDDDFNARSQPEAVTVARELSDLSIGDNPVDSGFANEADSHQENNVSAMHLSSDTLARSEAAAECVAEVVGGAAEPRGSLEPMGTDIGSPDLMAGKSSDSKGTSVKEVQWSSFYADSQQSGVSDHGFGSYLDFVTDNVGLADELNSSFMENEVGDSNLNPVQSGQHQDAQLYSLSANSQNTTTTATATTDVNDPQYWDNLYPGWKYDMSTGQWYQVVGYDTTMNTQAQSNDYAAATVNAQESFQEKDQVVGDEFVLEQRSEVSYLQQTANSLVRTVAEDSTIGVVSKWNQVAEQSTGYPPNMVFDPQYPGWYFDTNSQQWYTLESYTQTFQTTDENQMTQNENASHGYSSTGDSWTYNDIGQFGQNTVQGNSSLHSDVKQSQQNNIQGHGSQETVGNWNMSISDHAQQNLWQPEKVDNSAANVSGNQHMGIFYGSTGHVPNYSDQHAGFKPFESFCGNSYDNTNGVSGFQSFVLSENVTRFSQSKEEQNLHAHVSHSYYGNKNSMIHSPQPFQGMNALDSQSSYKEGRSSAGRPPHALVTFGFGGKLIVMKDPSSFSTKLNHGSQDTAQSAVSVLSLMEVLMVKTDASSIRDGNCGYFNALCQQSFPGPLVGGNAAAKDVHKWIDENILHCESPSVDPRKGELLKLLLSLLKISCQHYGKLRSPFGSDPSLQEIDGPESAVTKLFAFFKKNSAGMRKYSSFDNCMQSIPSEAQIQITALEVQNLLVSGRRKDALECAQHGQLWGPALVLAAQLGEKSYIDTVKKMAQQQFISGSPLRTLCLLIAGQPADVFSVDSSNVPQQPTQVLANGMLDEWEENLAIITANRTKDDELVIVHLGDCLWKERGEVTAAHTCYLVAEANFESYSDSARLCLIGADHFKCPRTYANPEAIQRTELFEYSKVLGNSQFILLPFQPYKLIYAYMLAEVGKVSDSLRYCQASLKSLKNSGRAPEIETWKMLLTSLEERLRTHQQGGYSTNLDPAKLVGKLFTSIDRSIHRMMGAPPSTLPPMPPSNVNGEESHPVVPKVVNSHSTMAMSSLIPSPSVEAISEWTGDSNRRIMHNRSVSEPDFGRSPKQDRSKDTGSSDSQSKASVSRFGRIGSQLFQKTIGWVSRSRPDRQAKLGERNKFYYDEKLKRWVEEGAEPPAEEAALPPPPTMASFQNGMSDYNINSTFKGTSPLANGGPEAKSPNPSEHGSGIPPMPPSTNQFSARGQLGVRSRYVDTFNKGGGTSRNSFQSPSAGSVKPPAGAKFFIPTTPATSSEAKVDSIEESIHDFASNGEQSTSALKEACFPSPQSSTSSSSTIQLFSSIDSVTPGNKVTGSASLSGSGFQSSHTRAASWSGSYSDTSNPNLTDSKFPGDELGVPSSFKPCNPSPICHSSSSLQLNGGRVGNELHEVEL